MPEQGSKLVLGIVGMPAAGKGTTAEYLAANYGAQKLRFSDALKAILDRIHVEPTRDHLITLSEAVREQFGEDVLSHALVLKVTQSPAMLSVVDGVRREADITAFKGMKGFHLIALEADAKLRYERSKARAEKPEEQNQTFESFMELEERSTEVSARELIGKAEVVINNNGTLDELYWQIDVIINNWNATAV